MEAQPFKEGIPVSEAPQSKSLPLSMEVEDSSHLPQPLEQVLKAVDSSGSRTEVSG